MVGIEPKRNQHALGWLVEQVGLEGIAEACAKLRGARRPHPPNNANVLVLMPLQWFAVATKTDVSTDQKVIERSLGVRSCT